MVHIGIKELLPHLSPVLDCGLRFRLSHLLSIHYSITGHGYFAYPTAIVVTMINEHTSTNPMVMYLLRYLLFVSVRLTLSAKYVEDSSNKELSWGKHLDCRMETIPSECR